jgi:ABC-type lipoprotein release transport system permease subunit
MRAPTKLLGFKYLKRQRILTLIVILTLASMLFSITAFSLTGFLKGFNAYLGEEENIMAIYDRNSRTPFTGLVPAYLTEEINAINGVTASSAEVIIPCLIKDNPILLRGIIPEDFAKLNPLSMLEGNMLELSDTQSLIVGKNVAERLNLKVSDSVLVTGVMANQYLTLQVKGIYESHAAMDDEVLAPLYMGQWLRGTDYGHATLIRIKIDKDVVNPTVIFEAIAKEASEQTPNQAESQKPTGESIIPQVRAPFKIENIGVADAQKFMGSFMDRYGVTKEAILILSIMVLLFSSASVTIASKTIITQHKNEVAILKSIGASKKTIKIDVLAKLLPYAILASAIGIIAAAALLTLIQEEGYLQVLSHTVPFQLDTVVIAANLIIISLLVTISILRSDLN